MVVSSPQTPHRGLRTYYYPSTMSSTNRATVVLALPVVLTILFFWGFDDVPGPRWSRETAARPHDNGVELSLIGEDDVHREQRKLLGKESEENDILKWSSREADEKRPKEEEDDRLLREMIAKNAIKEDAPLPKEQKMWFMLKRRGWQNETDIKHALEILRRTDELLTQRKKDYFLMYGSLLGHCRHAAFIPWDDDMDIAAARSTVEWLATPDGIQASAAHGLEVKQLGSRYVKLFLSGRHIPRAGEYSWGYPFLDVFPYEVNATTGLLEIYGEDPLPPELYFPVRRVDFHPGVPQGLLVPYQAGAVLDALFPGWRTTCKMDGYNHRLEDGDDHLSGPCRVLARAMGVKLASPFRCPSASMPRS